METTIYNSGNGNWVNQALVTLLNVLVRRQATRLLSQHVYVLALTNTTGQCSKAVLAFLRIASHTVLPDSMP